MRLGEVAVIRSGLVLARKAAQNSNGITYYALNLRSINDEGYIDLDKVDRYDAIEELNPEYITQVGDVVIRMSSPYTAVLIDESSAGMVVSSNFVIVRADTRYVLPKYLFWLLNTPKMKQQIYENTTSNMMGSIKAKYYVDMPITPISLQEQQRIAEINALAKRERQLLIRLAEEKDRYYTMLIDQVQKDMRRNMK